jgi:AcrR family transcriptional regulator
MASTWGHTGGVTAAKATGCPPRPYHHGDLANALVDAATELAIKGGPNAIVLREAARQVGVTATAAYRHFADHADLVHAVKDRAQDMLAEQMSREQRRFAARDDDPVALLRAFGTAYVRFALERPGLFRTAFAFHVGPPHAEGPMDWMAKAPGYQLLVEVIDRLTGRPTDRPRGTPRFEVFAWSTVHGLAVLLLDGPLSGMSEQVMDELIDSTIELAVSRLADVGSDAARR